MAVTPKRGITRRSFLIATTTAGGVGAAAYAWNRFGNSSSEPEVNAEGLIEGQPLALTPSGMLLDTEFPDPFAQGQFFGYLPFHSRDEDQFRGPFYENSHGGHDA